MGGLALMIGQCAFVTAAIGFTVTALEFSSSFLYFLSPSVFLFWFPTICRMTKDWWGNLFLFFFLEYESPLILCHWFCVSSIELVQEEKHQ